MQYILIFTDPYFKLTHALPTFKKTSTNIANLFFDHCFVPYGILPYLLTNNGAKFTRKFFAAFCTLLGVQHVTTTAYYMQTKAKLRDTTKHSSLTFDVKSRNTKTKYIFAQPLTYAWNTRVRRRTSQNQYSSSLVATPGLQIFTRR